jgi:ArsR family transcriptional regulator, arsenate/arsenite/antimonite-responsive transcriptional repressor
MMTSARADPVPPESAPEAEVLRVLADPLRLRIVQLLAHETLCTTHLVEETGARQTNLSNHLRVLRDAGVVETEPCGRFTYYRLRPEGIAALAASLGGLAETARATLAADTKRSCP